MPLSRPITRGELLKAGVGVGAAAVAGSLLAACGSSTTTAGTTGTAGAGATEDVTLNWLTWSDHYLPAQLSAVRKETGITGKPILFTDDAAAYLKLRQGGTSYDIVSADALWVPKDHKDGLVEAFDLDAIGAAKGLFPVARTLPYWQADGGYLAYPKGWSMSILYYNPKFVTTKPDSWQALLDPKYKGRIIAENSASALLADAGVAVGAKDPTNMTTAELSQAKDYLKQLKPNVLKLASQGDEVIRALADESAWIGIQWLGTEDRVKAAGGPEVRPAIPREGTTGWVDGELMVKASKHKDAFPRFLDAMETPEWTAKVFLKNGHPMLNRDAYKWLVDNGHKDQADRALYNDVDEYLPKMTLWGPSQNEQAYTDTFNEVFAS
jgi:spermidine/putrescine transport system substrate-binding protein